jgi:hypothetical protein
MNKLVQSIKTNNAFARRDYWLVVLTFFTWLVVMYQFVAQLVQHPAPPGALTLAVIYLSIVILVPVVYLHQLTVLPLTMFAFQSVYKWFAHEPGIISAPVSIVMLMALWIFLHLRVVAAYKASQNTHESQG